MIVLGQYNVDPVLLVDINGNPLGSLSNPTYVSQRPSQVLSYTGIPKQAQRVELVHSGAISTITSVNATALSGTYTYGQGISLSGWDNVILELTANSILGSVTGLQAQIQMLSYTGIWGPAVVNGFTNPTTAIATIPTGSSILLFIPLTKPFHGIVRVGFAATAAGTGGTFAATFHLQK